MRVRVPKDGILCAQTLKQVQRMSQEIYLRSLNFYSFCPSTSEVVCKIVGAKCKQRRHPIFLSLQKVNSFFSIEGELGQGEAWRSFEGLGGLGKGGWDVRTNMLYRTTCTTRCSVLKGHRTSRTKCNCALKCFFGRAVVVMNVRDPQFNDSRLFCLMKRL